MIQKNLAGLLTLLLLAMTIAAHAQEKKKTRIRPVLPYHHATLNAPPNMVYIRGGSTTIKYDQSLTDSVNGRKKISLTSFFIDKTEVSNQQYRKFTEWVIDSIAIYRYLGDDSYFLGAKGDSSTTVNSQAAGATITDTVAKEVTIATPAAVEPEVADSEITYDSVIVDNTPVPTVNENVKQVFNKALQGITFETAKDIIRPTSFPVLDEVATALRENPTVTVQINGHTDNQGRAQANQVLSEKRAASVKNYLVSKGISAGRMRTAGYGGERPIADNNTPAGREKNRRVEFIADIPPAAATAATSAGGAAAPRTRTIKVHKMVKRTVSITAVAEAADDTTRSFRPGTRRINWAIVNHKKIFSNENRKKLAPLLDENGNIRPDKYMFRYTYDKEQDIANSKLKKGIKAKETINIYPDENVWAEDMTNSQTDLLVENYFKTTPYDDYPVVGVTWRQARAYCYWRSITAQNYDDMPDFMKYYRLTYTLPTEAQWSYAASGYYDMIRSNMDTAGADTAGAAAITAKSDTFVTQHDSAYVAAVVAQSKAKAAAAKGGQDNGAAASDGQAPVIDSTPIHKDEIGLLHNFKQDEGDYWEDGGALTLPVMAYAPNQFGLYNMEGNVAEWTLDAYSPSAWAFISDLNPALLYDADPDDPESMRRKVVRGGSFMSNAKALSPDARDLELESIAHCYIGFRCVAQAPEVLYRPVQTRKKKMVGHSATKLAMRH